MRWPWPLLILFLLNACGAVPVTGPGAGSRSAYEARAESISGVMAWSLVGRISLDDGDAGGSGKLQWVVEADHSRMDFHGAMGRGAWRLEIDPEGAVLELADGSIHSEADVDELVQRQAGWPVPVQALQWWVRGLAAPGPVDAQQLDAASRLAGLSQFGWQIEFDRYVADTGFALPTRLDVRKNNYRVKLAISQWRMSGDDARSD